MSKFDAREYLRNKRKGAEDEENKELQNSGETFNARDYLTKKSAASKVGFDTFSDDLNTFNSTLNGIYSGWQDANTMSGKKSEVEGMYNRLLSYEDYRKNYGTEDFTDLSELATHYKGALDEWDSLAEMYGGYDSADAFNVAVKAQREAEEKRRKQEEEWKSADLDALGKEVTELEGILAKAKEYDKNVYRYQVAKDSEGYTSAQSELKNFLASAGYSSIGDVEKAISDKKKFVRDAEPIQNEDKALKSEDFEKYSKIGAEVANPSYDDALQSNILGWKFGGKEIPNKAKFVEDNSLDMQASRDPESASSPISLYYLNMNEDEKKAYYYYLGLEQEGKAPKGTADEYFDNLLPRLKSRYEEGQLTQLDELAHGGFWAKTGASAMSVAYSLGGAVEHVADSIEYGKTGIMDDNFNARASSTIRSRVSQDVDWEIGNWDAFDFVYNTGMSMADSAAVMWMPGGTGAAVLGLSAAGQGVNDALDRGLSDKEAFWNGFMSGAFEMAFEKVSIGNFKALKDMPVDGWKTAFKNLGKTMLVNASEETLTELANIAYDTIAHGDLSQYEMRVQELLDSNPKMTETEAKHKAALEFGGRVLESGASGAFMGLGFGTVGNASAAHNTNVVGKNITANKNVGDVFNTASVQLSPEEASAYEAYSNYAKKGVTAENAKTRQVGTLALNLKADAEAVLASKDATPEQRAQAERTLQDLRSYTQGRKVSDFSSDIKEAYKSKESVKALIQSGLAGDKDSESYKLAREYRAKLIAGKKLSEAEITRLSDMIAKEELSNEASEAKAMLTELGEAENVDRIAEAISKKSMGYALTSEETSLIENSKYGGKVVRELVSDTILASDEFSAKKSGRSEALTEEKMLSAKSGANSTNAELMEYADGMPEEDRQLFIDTYDGKMPLEEYATAFALVNDFAKKNADGKNTQATLLENGAGLSAAQIGKIYKSAVIAPRLARQKAIDELVLSRQGKLKYKARVDDSVIDYDNKGTKGKVNWNSLTPKQREAITFIKGFARGMGINLTLSAEGREKGYHAKYDATSNTITMDIYAGIDDIMMSDAIVTKFSHEITHWAKLKAPQLYAELSEKVFDVLKAKRGLTEHELVLEEQKRLKEEAGIDKGYDYARDEIIARACEDMLSMGELGKEVYNSLSESDRKTLREKIIDLINDALEWIDKLLGKYVSNSDEAKSLRDMKEEFSEIKKIWDEMIISARDANAAMQTEAEVEETSTLEEQRDISEADSIFGELPDNKIDIERLAETHEVQLNERYTKKHIEDLKNGYSTDASIDYDTLMGRYQKIIDIWKKLGGELKSKFLTEWNNKEGKDRVFEVFKAQAGYDYNIELSSMCKKGIPLFEAIDAIVKREVMKELTVTTLGKAEKEILYDLLKRDGFEIPCAICYVEQARQREGVIIDAFLDGKVEKNKSGNVTKLKLGWNETLLRVQERMKNTYGVDYKIPSLDRSVATDKYTPAEDNMDAETQNAFYSALKDIANEEIERYNATPERKGKPKRALVEEITPSAIAKVFKGKLPGNLVLFKTLFLEPSSRFVIDNDLLYSSSATQNIAAYHHNLYKLFNMQGGVNGYKTKQGAVIYWGDILGKKWRPDVLRKKGGVRNQSNSDFMMYTLLDHAQMYIDFTAKGYYLQAYTKVLAELKLFGLSKGKINASLIPKVVVYKLSDNEIDVEKTKKYAGLDENGNPIYDDYEGINHTEAFMLLEDAEYSKCIGGVCIGYSDEHILRLLDERRVQLIIGFHDKTNDGEKRYRGAKYAFNYNGYNEATKKGEAIVSEADTDSEDGKKTKHINFNEFLQKAEGKFKKKGEGMVEFGGKTYTWNDVPRLAADMYIQYCDEKDLAPAYSRCGYDFSKHPNYYKLLADFSLYDINGSYCPHEKVEYNMPDRVPYLDESGNKAYISTEEYIKLELSKEIAVRDAISERLSDTSENGLIPQFVKKVNELHQKQSEVVADGEQLSERIRTRITADMSDEERTEILSKKSIVAPIYEGQADSKIQENTDKFKSEQIGLVKKTIVAIAEHFGIIGADIRIEDVDVEITLSRSNLKESVSKKATPVELAKLLPILKESVSCAIGIERHDNRYYFDNDTVFFENLLGGYAENEYFVPVRFGLKHSKTGKATLYVVVDQNKIPLKELEQKKKTEVVNDTTSSRKKEMPSRSVEYSISQIIPFVKSKDLLRYIPDDMLDNEQKKAKWEAIAETIIYTNNKNDERYADFISEGNTTAAKGMVEEAARKNGYTRKMFHETDAENIHIFDISMNTHGETDSETPYGIFTKSSDKNIGLGSRQMELFVKAERTLNVANRQDVKNKIPELLPYYDEIARIDREYDALIEKLEDAEMDILYEWLEEHPDVEIDEVYSNEHIAKGKPADIDSQEYLEAHNAYVKAMEEWKRKYGEIAVKCKKIITSYLRNNNYDSMYFAVDGGSRGRQTDSLILLDKNQVKSADTFTYDDEGNIIPISQRFNSEDDDIRYSERTKAPTAHDIMGEKERLEKRYAKLKVDFEAYKKWVKLDKTLTRGKVMNRSQLEAVARYLVEKGDSTYKVSELMPILNDLYVALQDGALNDNMSWEQMYQRAYEVAREIRSEAKIKTERPAYFDMILKDIRSARIAPNEGQKGDAKHRFGDHYIGKFRGRVTIANDGVPLDIKWQEWANKYPSVFDKTIGDAQQLVELYDIYDDLRNASDVVVDYDESEMLHSLATEIVNKAWTVAKFESTADKHRREIQELNAEHRKNMEELRSTYKKREADTKLLEQMYYGKTIAELRRKRKEDVARAKELGRERLAQYREEAERKAAIQTITSDCLRLRKMLLDNSKDSHVHEALKTPVIELLTAIDFSSKRLLEKGIPTNKDISLADALAKVKGMMDKASKGDDDLVALYGHGLDESIEKMMKTVGVMRKTVADNEYILQKMSLDNLVTLKNIVKTLKHAVNKLNEFHVVHHAAGIANLSKQSIRYLDSLGRGKVFDGWRGKLDETIVWNNTLPYYAFKRYGEGGVLVLEAIMDGWDKFAFNVDKIMRFAENAYTDKEIDAWENEVKTFKIAVPKTAAQLANSAHETEYQEVQMTIPQIMSLYCLQKRNQAKKHLLEGGIRVDNFKNNKGEIIAQGEGAVITARDIEVIVSSLSERQKAVADKLQEFMNTVCSDWGNEVSMARFGIKQFGELHYFPIKSDDTNLSRDEAKEEADSFFKLLSASFTKGLEDGANNRIVISNIFDVFAKHTSDMAKYNALALPVLDAFRWYNYKEKKNVGDEGAFKSYSLKQSMEVAFGKDGVHYFTTFLKDINGAKTVSRDTIGNGFIKNDKIASVGANLKVIFLQPTSYLRASAVISDKYLTKALSFKDKARGSAIKMAEKYCGIALWKSLGYYDTNVQQGVTDQIKHKKHWHDKATDLSMKGAEMADKLTWGLLWNACELEIRDTRKDLKVGSKEFYTVIGKRLREVIYATQVVDSTMTRSQMMRSGDKLDKLTTSFMSEPTLAYNMLLDAVMDIKLESRRSNTAEAWKKYGWKVARTAYAYTITNALAALIETAVEAYRDEDDEEKDFIAYVKMYLLNFATDMGVIGKIPIIKDIVSICQGYDSSYSILAGFEGLYKAVTQWWKIFTTDKGNPRTAIKNTLKALSSIFGLPLYNVYRDVKLEKLIEELLED